MSLLFENNILFFQNVYFLLSLPVGKQLDVKLNRNKLRSSFMPNQSLYIKAVVLVLLPTNSGEDPKKLSTSFFHGSPRTLNNYK